MGSINQVLLMGRVGNEPEQRTIDTDKGPIAACRFRLATHEKFRLPSGSYKKHTEWHTCECYEENARTALDYVKKGDEITLMGKIFTDTYTDKTGAVKYFTYIKVNRLVLHAQAEPA